MKQTLNEQLSRIKQMMNAVSPILNEEEAGTPCFNYDYIKTIVVKNGVTVKEDPLETEFTPAADQSNLDRNKELGLASSKKIKKPFKIEDVKKELDLDLFETDPYIYFYAETEEASKLAKRAGRLANSMGLRVEYNSNNFTSAQVYVDNEPGQTVECGNYEIIMARIGRFAELMKALGPNFFLPYITSSGE
jgi:hypothetical protein